jgi:hypothetical protein
MASALKYLSGSFKADDLGDIGDTLTLTISKWGDKTFQDKPQPKLVLNFIENGKQLILNATNLNTLIDAFGDDPDEWIGSKITLECIETTFGNKTVKGIKVIV